jgi:predicted Zn-dependent protease
MATLMNSEAEMASVLGHEIGHVTARHSVSQISQQQLAQLGLGVGGLIIPELEPYGGLLSAGLGLLFLRHSREAERQADDLGFKYALGGGYAVTEMADVFRALERMAPEGRTALPSFLTTHPSPGERVATIEAKVAGLPSGSRGTRVGEADYLRQIDGLVFGEDPTQGFFRNSEFLHPSLRFRFAFPRGWTGENLRQAVLLSSARQDAALQLTIAGQSSPDAAARQFGSQQGVALGGLSRQSINGLSAVVGSFEAATESGRLVGLGGWISHGGRTYQLLAYTSASAFPSYENAFGQVIGSFGPLRDAVALGVQPKRVDIVTVPARLTLSEFNRRMPSSVSLDLLSVLNGVSGPSAVLAQGELAKRIVN